MIRTTPIHFVWKLKLVFTFLILITESSGIQVHPLPGLSSARTDRYYQKPLQQDLLNKISLTQKGYIQFLRYIVDVPIITEFTFCIWLKSANFTYAHPLLSYSKHETTSYIRSWISPHGKQINLGILNEVYRVNSDFRENCWYHICQSLDSKNGIWSYHLNGKLETTNYDSKLHGIIIPKGGDIVVGTEYTDFDKGLDDGIEGDIFGFNLVLAPTTGYTEVTNNFVVPYEFTKKRALTPNEKYGFRKVESPSRQTKSELLEPEHRYSDETSAILSYLSEEGNRMSRSIPEIGNYVFQKFIEWLKSEHQRDVPKHDFINVYEPLLRTSVGIASNLVGKRIIPGTSNRVSDDIGEINHKPLGLQLVELSYNCTLGKGSPINHEKVLVSWTKTPVRVFGGAILKDVSPFCYF